jgi:hypothetical protein
MERIVRFSWSQQNHPIDTAASSHQTRYYLNDQGNECGDIGIDELAMGLEEQDDDDRTLCQDLETEQTLGQNLGRLVSEF